MSAHRRLSWLTAWCALLLAPSLAAAQLSIEPVRGLAFGQLTPGASEAISPNDAARRAELQIRGSGIFTLEAVLPNDLVSASGDLMPLQFSSGDGVIRWMRFGIQYGYDITSPTTVWLPSLAGGASIYIGGRADPTTTQPPGVYTESITLIISNAGT